MRSYVICPASGPVLLCGELAGTAWADANVLRIDRYPWYKSGRREATEVRVLYDDEAVYAQFRCEDRNIFSRVTRLNGSVCHDSCVEFFASVDPETGPNYFNLEINCCGTLLLQFGPERFGRLRVTDEQASRVHIATSQRGGTKMESPDDDGWWVAVALPFDLIREMSWRDVRPSSGDQWRGSFFRCGGRVDPQFACWNHIDLPYPDFHRPESFGRLRFG